LNFFSRKQDIISTSIIVEDACCEYCIKGFIEYLILLEGIEMASADFDYETYFDISIKIKYDKKLYNEKNIKDLVVKNFH
jgi:copper chaperone CopZ